MVNKVKGIFEEVSAEKEEKIRNVELRSEIIKHKKYYNKGVEKNKR